MNKLEAIKRSKVIRQNLDATLQDMKDFKRKLIENKCCMDEEGFNDIGETIAQCTLSQRDLESAIMRQGMVLKNIAGENPYPTSYDPSSSVVEPVAGGLKM